MVFSHDLSKYHFQLAQQYNPPEGDRYYTPLNAPEPQFPSITGVLGADPGLRKKLFEWKLRIGEEEAQHISSEAAHLGSQVHDALEKLVLNQEVEESKLGNGLPYYLGLKKHLRNSVEKLYAAELMQFSNELKIAGQVDLICDWKGKLVVADHKNWKQVYPDKIGKAILQTAFHAICFHEANRFWPELLICTVGRPHGRGEVHAYRLTDALINKARSEITRLRTHYFEWKNSSGQAQKGPSISAEKP